MKYDRVYNFSAGPAMMPEPVLEEIRSELLNYRGSGMSVMEMSHRSPVFQQILQEAKTDLRALMDIPEDYEILFIQGGGTVQFSMVPLNLMPRGGKADYIISGHWSRLAFKEAQKFGDVQAIASGEDCHFSALPDYSDLPVREDASYVYICENETIHGLTYPTLPDTKGKILVADQSSMFLSRPCDVRKYGLIFAGVQKNVGPAGLAVVIIRRDLLDREIDPQVPVYLRYGIHAGQDSLYNTPNCWGIYCCGKVFRYLLEMGGLSEMARRNEEKAAVLYEYLDSSKLFHGAVRKEYRSLMNVPFFAATPEQETKAVAAAKAAGFDNLKGHRTVGGLRASIYNAMPKEGVEALVQFLRDFEAKEMKGE